MSVNIGLVGMASVVSGQAVVVSAITGSNIANSAVRVFDAVLIGSGNITLYAGSSTTGTAVINLNPLCPLIHSDVGYRFIGGVFASTATNSAGAMGTINYIHEF